MTDEERALALEIWRAAGEQLLGADGAYAQKTILGHERATPDRLKAAIARLGVTLPAVGVAVGMPLDERAEPLAVGAAMRLCHEAGLRGFCTRAKSPAATREVITSAAIEAGCDRLLLVGYDSVIDRAGFWQLMSTMDRHGMAAVAAVSVVPVVPPSPPDEISAYVGGEDDVRRMRKEDMPRTGVPIPVHHLDGIVALLIDLVQVRRYAAPRWSQKTEGDAHVSEDEGFAKWLDMHGMEIFVDFKARVARVGSQLYGSPWQPQPEDG